MSKFPIWVFIALLPIGCKSSKENTNSEIVHSVSLQRTPCYGTCPQYTIELNREGVISYSGQRFTDKIGKWELTVPPDSLVDLFAFLDRCDWSQYDSIYPSPYSDLPSVILKLNLNQYVKSITLAGEHPAQLDSIVQYIDRWSNLQGYRNISSAD